MFNVRECGALHVAYQVRRHLEYPGNIRYRPFQRIYQLRVFGRHAERLRAHAHLQYRRPVSFRAGKRLVPAIGYRLLHIFRQPHLSRLQNHCGHRAVVKKGLSVLAHPRRVRYRARRFLDRRITAYAVVPLAGYVQDFVFVDNDGVSRAPKSIRNPVIQARLVLPLPVLQYLDMARVQRYQASYSPAPVRLYQRV